MNTRIIFYEPRLFDDKLFHLVELFFHKERNGTLKQWIDGFFFWDKKFLFYFR